MEITTQQEPKLTEEEKKEFNVLKKEFHKIHSEYVNEGFAIYLSDKHPDFKKKVVDKIGEFGSKSLDEKDQDKISKLDLLKNKYYSLLLL